VRHVRQVRRVRQVRAIRVEDRAEQAVMIAKNARAGG
jgi:hypothetical protein